MSTADTTSRGCGQLRALSPDGVTINAQRHALLLDYSWGQFESAKWRIDEFGRRRFFSDHTVMEMRTVWHLELEVIRLLGDRSAPARSETGEEFRRLQEMAEGFDRWLEGPKPLSLSLEADARHLLAAVFELDAKIPPITRRSWAWNASMYDWRDAANHVVRHHVQRSRHAC